jgi:hypothetical protein
MIDLLVKMTAAGGFTWALLKMTMTWTQASLVTL